MLIIFDCDGVLIDSEILSARVDCEILGELGYEITPEELAHRFAGLTTERIFELVGEGARPRHSRGDVSARGAGDRSAAEEEVSRSRACRRCSTRSTIRAASARTRGRSGCRSRLIKAGLWDRFRPYVFSAQRCGERPRQAGAGCLPACGEDLRDRPGRGDRHRGFGRRRDRRGRRRHAGRSASPARRIPGPGMARR